MRPQGPARTPTPGVRPPHPLPALLAAPALFFSACIDPEIESRPDAAGSGANGNGNGEECSLGDESLEPETFDADVLPGLVANCNASSCHDPGTAGGGFAVHGGSYLSDNDDQHCAFVDSIESFASFADRETPSESDMLKALDGRTAHTGGEWDENQEPRPSIESYLEAIAGGGSDAPGLAAFESDIQPILDGAGGVGCPSGDGGGACHDTGIGGFTLISEPDPGSGDMRANYDEVVAQSDPQNPESSTIVDKGTTSHSGSPEFSSSERQELVDWIATLAE